MKTGILLYGPPASGKDTITIALTELNPSYGLFSRMKVGSGRTQGYRTASREQLETLEARGHVLYRNDRYDSTYVVDRPDLDEAMSDGRVPIVHLGQIAGVQQVAASYPARWWKALLRRPATSPNFAPPNAATPTPRPAWQPGMPPSAISPHTRTPRGT
ncbi:guanylate kinase [Streptomyces sp. NPDC050610]|uniref:guanylate kinase n=1 Tax=Streptomyces sp. NPDC050610 TaxID=3157097 RepID=UPI0034276990